MNKFFDWFIGPLSGALFITAFTGKLHFVEVDYVALALATALLVSYTMDFLKE